VAEPGEGGDNPPSPPPAAGGAGASTAPRTGLEGTTQRSLRNLRVANRLTLRALRRKGLRIQVQAPADTRALRLTLLRKNGRAKTRVAATLIHVRRGGRLQITWKLNARTLRALRPGIYVVRVQAGPSRSRIRRTALERTLRLAAGSGASRR